MASSRRRLKESLDSAPAAGPLADATEHDIAIRAYQLYEQRGGAHGRDLDDWLQAERELRSSLHASAA